MIQIEEKNWETSANTKAYLVEVCQSLTEYLGGKDVKIVIAPDTDLSAISSSLREIADMFDCFEQIMGRTEDKTRDPFARPSDDECDPSDFWKLE